MAAIRVMQCALRPGQPMVEEARAPVGDYTVVFEDDGQTGYFYAVYEPEPEKGIKILDAVHIYDVEALTDRDKPSTVEIWWTDDGHAAVLVINAYAHAMVDFHSRRMCCRSGFPPAESGFTTTHDWDESALAAFDNRHTSP